MHRRWVSSLGRNEVFRHDRLSQGGSCPSALVDTTVERTGRLHFPRAKGSGLSSMGGGVDGQDVVDFCQCRA